MGFSPDRLDPVIRAIHATPQRIVLEIAGAGVEALAWLHRVGGSSRTVLEATDRYASTSLVEAIGFEPEQFASPRVARAMAIHAYTRACHLSTPDRPVLGIGCTAAIATDRPKKGNHRCCLAVCDSCGMSTYTLTLAKGRRARQDEEHLVSLLIIKAVADVCGVKDGPELLLFDSEQLVEDYEAVDWLEHVLAGEVAWVALAPDGQARPGHTWPEIAFLSGAFNPLHPGHRQLAEAAARKLGQDVYFELPLVNAAKGPLEIEEARRRVAQFADWATVILTRTPLFNQKAQLFPRSVFVLGVDTVERLWEPRFYHDDPLEMYAAFNTIREEGCRFLVAGRLQEDRFVTLDDVEIPAGYHNLFTPIPAGDFRVDISSTTIRQNRAD